MKWHNIKRIWRNDRLEDYGETLHAALGADYVLVGLNRARDLLSESGKLMVLRHDVDHRTPATLAMAKLEHQSGGQATYYFRRCTMDLDLMKQVHDLGHEVSFHYETIADYFKRSFKNPFGVKVDQQMIETWQALLRDEISEFRSRCINAGFEPATSTVALHGDRVNRILKFPGNRLFECYEGELIPGVMDAYDHRFLDQFDVYISDCSLRIRDGYRYGVTPREAIQSGANRILFLSHPCHWHFSMKRRIWDTANIAVRGVNTKEQTFKS